MQQSPIKVDEVERRFIEAFSGALSDLSRGRRLSPVVPEASKAGPVWRVRGCRAQRVTNNFDAEPAQLFQPAPRRRET